jgi:hypothetical protein
MLKINGLTRSRRQRLVGLSIASIVRGPSERLFQLGLGHGVVSGFHRRKAG